MSRTNVRIEYSNNFSGCLIKLGDVELMLNIIYEYIENIKQHNSDILIDENIKVSLKNQPLVTYSNFEELKDDTKTKIYSVENITINFTSNYLINIKIDYYDNGNILLEVSGYFTELNDCWNHLYNILNNNKRHRNIIDKIFFNKYLIPVIIIFSVIYMILSINNIYYSQRYFLAKEIGVNIDESLIPLNNTIYLDIESAIKSDDLYYKLDTLLRINLRRFVNATDFIDKQIRHLHNNTIRLISTIIGLLLILIKTRKTRTYNIIIGLNEQHYRKKEKYRYFWTIIIFISIFINIVSNILSRLICGVEKIAQRRLRRLQFFGTQNARTGHFL